jgi:hypothetical protein
MKKPQPGKSALGFDTWTARIRDLTISNAYGVLRFTLSWIATELPEEFYTR